MKKFIYIILLLSSISLFAQIDSKIVPGDAKNFEMSKWDDKTAFLDWKIYGDEGKYQEGNVILIKNMRLDIFDGSKEEKQKIKVNSDYADVYLNTKSAGGDDVIYAKGDSFDLEGRTWLWESTNRKISIFNNLKIKLKAKDGDSESDVSSSIGYFYHLKDKNIFELERKVKVKDADSDIECDSLVITTDKDSMRGKQASARSVDAKGNVKIVHKKEILAHCDELDISPTKDIATLIGNAKLEDIKSNTTVFGDKIELNKKNNKAKVFSKSSERAKASIPQKGDDGEIEIINIYANEILMTMHEENVEVRFVGDVVLKSKEFTASCDTMTSLATKEGEKDFELLKVIGNGAVVIKKGDSVVASEMFFYTPATSEVILTRNAIMQDKGKGVYLKAHTVILDRDNNKAIALAKEEDTKSFIHVQISQLSSNEFKNVSELNIFSRQLLTTKKEDDITFNFEKNVKVKSGDMQASCQKMNIYAKGNKKGRSQIAKIEAFDDIIIKQAQYIATAQLARIFPSVKLSDEDGDVEKSYTELLTASAKPDLRPQIILAPIGNIGLNEEMSQGREYKNTEITSDKQSLVEGTEFDRYFFEGNVIVDATDMEAKCNKIEVKMSKAENISAKKISQIIATEDVQITQGLKEAKAQRCDIFPEEEMLTLSGEPVVLDKESNTKASGYRMTYRKGKRGISIEGNKDEDNKEYKRPTITLPPIK